MGLRINRKKKQGCIWRGGWGREGEKKGEYWWEEDKKRGSDGRVLNPQLLNREWAAQATASLLRIGDKCIWSQMQPFLS